ncbi:MAG: sugar transferase [Acidimicrobiia bacterium]|nr:sugar transferase [Acidimicrobiia bacterium]
MRRRFVIRTAALDIAALAVSGLVASLLVFERLLPWRARPGIWPLLAFLLLGLVAGSYVSARMWGTGVPRPSYGRALYIAVTSVAVTALGLVVTRAYFSRAFVATAAAIWLVLAFGHRAVSRSRPWTEPMVLVTGEKQFIDHLRLAPHAWVADVLDPRSEDRTEQPPNGVTVAVDLRAILSEQMAQLVASTNLAGYTVRSLANVYEEHTGRLPMVHLAEGWELQTPVEQAATYAPLKRSLDVFLVVLTSPLALLLSGLIWTAVRLDSPGAAVFNQQRVGRNGELFTLHKFRTMVDGADRDGARFAMADDERLTRVGRFLRRFRADELPQLWNVLVGDLSLVGPRPEQPEFVQAFTESIPFYAYRHLIRPGVTGWAQVNYGYADDEADTVEKLTYDLYYLKHMSLWLDLQVFGKSIWTVLSGFGAQ